MIFTVEETTKFHFHKKKTLSGGLTCNVQTHKRLARLQTIFVKCFTHRHKLRHPHPDKPPHSPSQPANASLHRPAPAHPEGEVRGRAEEGDQEAAAPPRLHQVVAVQPGR